MKLITLCITLAARKRLFYLLGLAHKLLFSARIIHEYTRVQVNIDIVVSD